MQGKVMISVFLDSKTHALLRKFCYEKSVTRSSVVQKYLEEALEKEFKIENPKVEK